MVLIEGEFPLTWFFATALLFKRETKVSSVYTWTDGTAEGVSITGFKMIFNHQNLGIDTSYVQISVISARYDTKYYFR